MSVGHCGNGCESCQDMHCVCWYVGVCKPWWLPIWVGRWMMKKHWQKIWNQIQEEKSQS